MDNPWLIALLGMSTVFLSLIAISLILQVFKPIFGGREKPFHDPAPLPIIMSSTVKTGPSNELIAVISAAVAAASGMAPGTFRIASLESAGGESSTPIWGRIDRMGRTSFKA